MRCWKSMLRPNWASKFFYQHVCLILSSFCSNVISFQGQLSPGGGDENKRSGDCSVDSSAEESWDDRNLPWTPGGPEGENRRAFKQLFFCLEFINLLFFFRRERTRNWRQSVMSLFQKWDPREFPVGRGMWMIRYFDISISDVNLVH